MKWSTDYGAWPLPSDFPFQAVGKDGEICAGRGKAIMIVRLYLQAQRERQGIVHTGQLNSGNFEFDGYVDWCERVGENRYWQRKAWRERLK